MKLYKFQLTNLEPACDLQKQSELNKHYRNGVKVFDIDFIQISKAHDIFSLSFQITFEERKLVLPFCKHRFELLEENGFYYLGTSKIAEFQKLELLKILLIKVESEVANNEFELTLFCSIPFTEPGRSIQYL